LRATPAGSSCPLRSTLLERLAPRARRAARDFPGVLRGKPSTAVQRVTPAGPPGTRVMNAAALAAGRRAERPPQNRPPGGACVPHAGAGIHARTNHRPVLLSDAPGRGTRGRPAPRKRGGHPCPALLAASMPREPRLAPALRVLVVTFVRSRILLPPGGNCEAARLFRGDGAVGASPRRAPAQISNSRRGRRKRLGACGTEPLKLDRDDGTPQLASITTAAPTMHGE